MYGGQLIYRIKRDDCVFLDFLKKYTSYKDKRIEIEWNFRR